MCKPKNPCWPSRRRRLPALVVLAAMVAVSSATFTQTPIEPAAPALDQTSAQQNPGVNPTSQQQPAAPTFQPTSQQLGDSLMAHQRYQAAIEAYKKAPQDSADVWNEMGIAYQMMFNLEDALRCYQQSLKLNPKNANVLNNLGTVYDSLKQYSSAERMYHKALRIDPLSALIHKNLGTNMLAQHKYKKGWLDYQAALAIDPHIFESSSSPRVDNPASVQDRGAMNYYMARGCVRAGQSDCAIEYLRMALNEGFTNAKKIQADSDFASLRGIPAFEKLLAAQRTQ